MVDYYSQSGGVQQEGGFVFSTEARKPGSDSVGWYRMDPLGKDDSTKPPKKFHISIDPAKIKEAWNIVAEEIIKSKADYLSARVLAPGTVSIFANPEHRHAGKMITFYTNEKFKGDAVEKFKQLLKDVERRLQGNKIDPGPFVKFEPKIPGSDYISGGLAGVFDAAAPRQPVSLQQIAKWDWQPAMAEGDLNIMRVPVSGPEEAEAKKKELEALKMKPQIVISGSLGLTVRLVGDDLKRIEQEKAAQDNRLTLQKVAGWAWTADNTSEKFEIRYLRVENEAAERKLIKDLASVGLYAIATADAKSRKVRISGDDMKKVLEARQSQTPQANRPGNNPPRRPNGAKP